MIVSHAFLIVAVIFAHSRPRPPNPPLGCGLYDDSENNLVLQSQSALLAHVRRDTLVFPVCAIRLLAWESHAADSRNAPMCVNQFTLASRTRWLTSRESARRSIDQPGDGLWQATSGSVS